MIEPVKSLTCLLKGRQKVFNLNQAQAGSCCQAFKEPLQPTTVIGDQINQWYQEAELLDQGVRLPGCETCWRDEDAGKISYRQLVTDSKNLDSIEIFLSNACNQMCSYCSPRYSSTWEKSMADHGNMTSVSRSLNQNLSIPIFTDSNQVEHWLGQIQHYIEHTKDHAIEIKLLGGEPLMQQKSLEKLLSFDPQKIRLTVITNLNPPNNKFLLWLLDKHPSISFNISIDASPGFNHIPRSGFDQNKFLQNLELLQHRNCDIKFLSTVSATSIFDLKNFVPWIKQFGKLTIHTKINNPNCLNINVVPSQFRNQILDTVENTDLAPEVQAWLLEPNDTAIDLKLFEQYNYLTQYFFRSNTDPVSVDNLLWVDYWRWLTAKFS